MRRKLIHKIKTNYINIKKSLMEHFELYRPEIFMIETVLGCNLRCPECAIGSDLIKRKKQCMSFEDFKTIADKIKPHCKYLYLHIWGEPMLNKDIIRMIEYASSFTKTNISTNANTLTPELAEQLIKSEVTDLIVSIDGTNDEIYKLYRIGGNYEITVSYLRLLQEINVKYGNKVNIIPQFCVFEHNQHQMEEFSTICKELDLNPYFRPVYIRKGSRLKYSKHPEYRQKVYKTVEDATSIIKTCHGFYNTCIVLVDGTVALCCYDHNGNINFGNIIKQSFKDIWLNKKFRELRKKAQAGDIPGFCLKNCLAYVYDPEPDIN
jgi:MoaA/NifB/PqqE/SkfB family radical SAM enzyme